jgi:hypothetical protein
MELVGRHVLSGEIRMLEPSYRAKSVPRVYVIVIIQIGLI